MTFVWIGIGVLLLVIVILTLVDIFRRAGPVRSMVGWAALVVVLPYIGAAIYWARRKPSQAEVLEQQLAQDDLRRAPRPPFNPTGQGR